MQLNNDKNIIFFEIVSLLEYRLYRTPNMSALGCKMIHYKNHQQCGCQCLTCYLPTVSTMETYGQAQPNILRVEIGDGQNRYTNSKACPKEELVRDQKPLKCPNVNLFQNATWTEGLLRIDLFARRLARSALGGLKTSPRNASIVKNLVIFPWIGIGMDLSWVKTT